MANYQHYNQIIIGKNYELTPYYLRYFCATRMGGKTCAARNLRNCIPKSALKRMRLRAKLVREIRAFWANKWYGETIPEIKKALVETTNLPEDVIEMLPEYFAYPYEIKRFPC